MFDYQRATNQNMAILVTRKNHRRFNRLNFYLIDGQPPKSQILSARIWAPDAARLFWWMDSTLW